MKRETFIEPTTGHEMAKMEKVRDCGACSLCCKLLSLDHADTPPEMQKPANVWCRQCRPGHGCKIYDTRPNECRDFLCLWVSGCFPSTLDYRPDHTKCVFCGHWRHRLDTMICHVDPAYPQAYKDQRVLSFISTAAQEHELATMLLIGTRRRLVVRADLYVRWLQLAPDETPPQIPAKYNSRDWLMDCQLEFGEQGPEGPMRVASADFGRVLVAPEEPAGMKRIRDQVNAELVRAKRGS